MKDVNIQVDSLDFAKPISFYAKFYGLSESAIRNRFKKLGIYYRFYFTKDNTAKARSKQLKRIYNDNSKKCVLCHSPISYECRKNTYCSPKCSAIHTQRNGGHHKWTTAEKQKLSDWAKKNAYRHERKGKEKECPNCRKYFYQHPSEHHICCSPKCFQHWNKNTGYLKGKIGGYRKEAGRGKMGRYKGYYCNSSWELAWVIYQLENGIKFERNTQGFGYEFEGKHYKFYPDFIIGGGKYVEIKGWVTKKDKEKIRQFQFPLNVLYKKDMIPILNYIVDKYGKDFTKLYDKGPVM
jgi:hypothetical protein